MSYCQYKIQCQNCQAETYLISLECNPIVYRCNSCNRVVVIHNDRAYTISDNFFIEMALIHNIKYCGQVIKCSQKSECKSYTKIVKRERITESDIIKLHDFLDKNKDSSEIIDKL